MKRRRQTGNKRALAAVVLATLAALLQHPNDGLICAAETANDDEGLSRPVSYYELLGLEDEWTHRRKSGVLHNRKKRSNYRNRILTSDIKKVGGLANPRRDRQKYRTNFAFRSETGLQAERPIVSSR